VAATAQRIFVERAGSQTCYDEVFAMFCYLFTSNFIEKRRKVLGK
jgi:hypothetical protein